MDTQFILLLGAAYFIGSIPFGLILTRLAGLGDIRQIGSGNIGATNVLRTGNKKLAALTLLLDGLKGFVAVYVCLHVYGPHLLAANAYTTCVGPDGNGIACYTYEKSVLPLAGVVGLLALIGHMHPIWLKFKGGKGVATILGIAWGLHPLLGAAACATWLLMALVFRYSSLSALAAVAALPGYAWYLGYPTFILPLTVMALLVWIRHHQNIARLLKGTEPKIGKKG